MIDRNVRWAQHCVPLLLVLSFLSATFCPGFCRSTPDFKLVQPNPLEKAVITSAQDYLQEVAAEGWYRWPREKLPVKVFFLPADEVPSYKESFSDTLRSCFDEWSAASDGRLAWREVTAAESADIVVRWSGDVQMGITGTEGGRTKTYGLLDTKTNVGTIRKAEMVLLTALPDRELSQTEVRKAYLHEVGHAFGIAGHSSSCDDIMYFAVSDMGSTHLGPRDRATINKLYSDYRPLNSMIGNHSNKTKRDRS
ncbi:MAG: hypothetical protein C0469_15445 [Cyanobacteria bacterium DS2.3.42]|nr:hypothetical protein [Cyanobacteria bacterium DS2.3.42]